jgi:Holliday junction resolvase RusA-like endonuclease
MIESSKYLPGWRDAVILAAKEAMRKRNRPPFATPCGVEIRFWLQRPRNPKFNLPGVPPDIDKIERSTLDGLVKGGALVDDALVVDVIKRKRFAEPEKGREVGAWITIWEVTE